jgi:hypothetical protein
MARLTALCRAKKYKQKEEWVLDTSTEARTCYLTLGTVKTPREALWRQRSGMGKNSMEGNGLPVACIGAKCWTTRAGFEEGREMHW